MAINFKNICKAIKASETLFVQYNATGDKIQVSDGHFIVEVPTAVYKKELLSATGTGVPTDKAKCLKRSEKKGEFEIVNRLAPLDQFGQVTRSAKRTRAIYELCDGRLVRLFKVDNGESVWVNELWSDFITGGTVLGGNRYKPIEISDGDVRALILPVRADEVNIEELLSAPSGTPKEVKDEPLSAPTPEVDEVEEAEEEDEAEEVTEDVAEEATDDDDLDTPESIAEAMVHEGDEEKPDTIDDWEVPSDVYVIVKPNGTMWVYGKTKPIKDELKRRKFHYAPKWEGAKKAGFPGSGWYRKPSLAVAAAD